MQATKSRTEHPKLSPETFPRINIQTHGELAQIIARADIAQMYLTRQIEPAARDADLIFGRCEVTARDIGECAHALGFSVEYLITDMKDAPEAQESEA